VVLCYFSVVLDVGGLPHLTALEPVDCGLKPVYLKALGGFLLMITDDGEVVYISENVESYLGISQVTKNHVSRLTRVVTMRQTVFTFC